MEERRGQRVGGDGQNKEQCRNISKRKVLRKVRRGRRLRKKNQDARRGRWKESCREGDRRVMRRRERVIEVGEEEAKVRGGRRRKEKWKR